MPEVSGFQVASETKPETRMLTISTTPPEDTRIGPVLMISALIAVVAFVSLSFYTVTTLSRDDCHVVTQYNVAGKAVSEQKVCD